MGGHDLGFDRVYNAWPKCSQMNECISLPCLPLIRRMSRWVGAAIWELVLSL